jgi:hypothetical protein
MIDNDELLLVEKPIDRVLGDVIVKQPCEITQSFPLYLIGFPYDMGAFICKNRIGEDNGPSINLTQEF